MIEKIARALCIARNIPPDNDIKIIPHEDFIYPAWQIFSAEARVVLMSMLEPTDEMYIDSDNLNRKSWNCHMCGGPEENYKSMIQAALDEK